MLLSSDHSKNRLQRSLFPILSLAIPLLVYAAVLIIGIPKEIGLAARYDFTPVLIAIALLFYPAYRLSGWIGTLTSLSLTLILFALPLSGVWNSGVSEEYIIGGLLPWSDATAYYWDARRLLEGGTFSVFSSRRPLFAGTLAALLGLTQQNLQVTLAILVAIATISCFLAAREVQRSHGIAAGLLVTTILFLFYRRFIGWNSTENIGLALGALGFALVWSGARQRHINHGLLGLLLLTLALNSRAGAFFILPAIILWGAWSFRGATRFSGPFLIGGASAVLLGFILNSILLKVIGSPEGMAFSNFSYTLYGLIVGGDWTQVLKDHPELNGLSDTEVAQRINVIAFEALRANPFGLVSGSLRAWRIFWFNDYIFSFIDNLKANFVLQLLSLVALFGCYRQRQEPTASLTLTVTLGILASVPFVPPWDADSMRAYAATLPFLALLPALGLAFLTKKMESEPLVKVPTQDNTSQFLVIFSVLLAGFVFVAPITTKVFSRVPQLANVSCENGMETVYLRLGQGSSVKLVADNSIRQTHVPEVRISDFRNGMATFSSLYPDLAKEFAALSPSTTMINSVNLKNLQQLWLITDSAKIPKGRGIVSVCQKVVNNPVTQSYGLFYADSIERVSR
jgi:hypothetical protein